MSSCEPTELDVFCASDGTCSYFRFFVPVMVHVHIHIYIRISTFCFRLRDCRTAPSTLTLLIGFASWPPLARPDVHCKVSLFKFVVRVHYHVVS